VLVWETDRCAIATLNGEHAGAVSLIADLISNRLISHDIFSGFLLEAQGLPPIVVSALQPRSRCDARNVTRGNECDLRTTCSGI
jgi:hypothetical protein